MSEYKEKKVWRIQNQEGVYFDQVNSLIEAVKRAELFAQGKPGEVVSVYELVYKCVAKQPETLPISVVELE